MAISKRKQGINDALAELVNSRYRIASESNREVHERAMKCYKQIKGTLFDTGLDEEERAYKDIQMNITLPITLGFKAMLAEILDPVIAQPFSLEPTPIVELPPMVARELRQAIEQNLPTLIEMAGGNKNNLINIIDEMTEATRQYEREAAQKAADRLTTVVRDKLVDAGFEKEFDDWLWNLCVYPLAIMKGPVYEVTQKRKWGVFGLQFTNDITMRVRNISPFDFFPAPKAKDPHTCPYVIERMRVHSGQLIDLVSASGYDADMIRMALSEYTSYILKYTLNNGDHAPDSDASMTEPPSNETIGYYDLLGYYGRIKGEYLREFGVTSITDDELNRMFEAEIWVLGKYVIKARLNPNDKGRRPFEVMAYTSTTGEMWGKSPVEILRDAQRQCTQSGRALARNMEYSSGPIGEVMSDNVIGKADPQQVYPMMMRAVKSTGNGQPVYRFHTVPSLAGELMTVFDKFYRYGFDLLGIPPISYGDATNAATLGRTSGGIAMVLNQANKPVKQAMARIESQVTKPIIQKFVDEEMRFNPDNSIKGDIQVQVRGVRTLAEKEQKDGKLEWALQSLAPFAKGVQIPSEVIMRLIIEIMKNSGLSTKGLPNYDIIDAVQNDLMNIAPVESQPPVAGINPTTGLDGRSQTAINQINSTGR